MHWLRQRSGFIPGEREAFEYVRERAAGRPILELGVGTGRTIAFTAPLTNDYRAIDYLPNMVAACRAAHPHARVELGDARTLEGIPSRHFGLVTFSFNGIDAVSHGDRARVFQAVRRVLAPGGLFFFSTLNLDGPEPRERPWHVPRAPSAAVVDRALHAIRVAWWSVGNVTNWLRLQPLIERGPGYSVEPLAAHAFGILAHYTTLGRQLEELAQHGFERDVVAFGSTDGARIRAGDDTRHVGFFHLVATARPFTSDGLDENVQP